MLDKFRDLGKASKALVITAAVMGVVLIGLVVVVVVTGGFTSPF